jgi:hypothetical protein
MSDLDTKLADLKLKAVAPRRAQLGYDVVRDMQHLSAAEMLRIPGMGGRHCYRKMAKALGREPVPDLKKL